MLRRAAFFISLVLSACSLALGQSEPITVKPTSSVDPTLKPPEPEQQPIGPHLKPSDLDSRQSLNNNTRMDLIRLLDAEFVHTRKYIPLGDKNMVIADDGNVKPGDDSFSAWRRIPGQRPKLATGSRSPTSSSVRSPSIWRSMAAPRRNKSGTSILKFGVGGGSSTDSNPVQVTGAALTLEFKQHVPEMTGAELKQILSPVLDFSVKTAAEVFADTLPPKIRQAVKNHEVLVGMNHDMVIMAKDRPQQKIREKDDQGQSL